LKIPRSLLRGGFIRDFWGDFVRSLLLLFFYTTSLFSFLVINGEGFYIGINQSSFIPITGDYSVVNHDLPPEEKIRHLTLITKSSQKVSATYYDRGSNVLLIAAPALPAPKESMKIFAKIFPFYDVIIFDYRWSGQYKKVLAKSIVTGRPVQRILFDPIEDLETVVKYATKQKKYKSVVGLGECYSCFHFAKLQSDFIKKTGSDLFTHLVLDSCWYSLRYFAERICTDPSLPLSPQDGGAPAFIKWLTDNCLFKNIVLGTTFAVMNDVSIKPYIAAIGIPVLFIHGKNDLFVPPKHFDKIWKAANEENRAVLLTPYRHSDNLKNKKVYRYAIEQFMANQTLQDFEKKF